MISSLATILFNGLAYAMLLFLIASGLTLVFGLMGVVNFAHGALYALGAYVAISTVQITGMYWLTFVTAFLVVGLVGFLIEYFTIRPLYGTDPIYPVLLTFGLAVVLEEVIPIIWGAESRSLSQPEYLSGVIDVGGLGLPRYRLFVIAIGILVMAGLWLLMQRTRLGMIIRAGTSDSEMVESVGINVRFMFTLMFAIGAGLAALSGVMAAPLYNAYPGMGIEIILMAFIVVVLGGLGSLRGSIVAALIIGLTHAFGSYYFSQFVEMMLFGLLAVVILLRPEGLYGRPGVFEH